MIKGISKTTKNEAKEANGRFFSMLLGTLGASLLGNLLTGKGMKPSKTLVDRVVKVSNRTRANIHGQGVMRPGEAAIATSQEGGTIIAGQNF